MNFFDFFVVTISIAGDILDRSIAQYNMSFVNMLLIFRAARVMRIFRLFTRFKGVRSLLETLLYTLPSLLNVTTLLVMVLFIYTILGMSFFGTMPLCPEGPCPYGLYNHHANFRYFYTGFFTLFRMSTGESWNGIMHDCTAVYGGKASFFFVSYMVIGSSLMFNLVIAILLDEFSSMGASDSYEVTPDAITKFGEHWQALDPSGSYVIPAKKLVALLRSVEPPLGVGPNGNAAEAHLMLLKVNAPLNAGHAHFVETFVALVRFAYKVGTPEMHRAPCPTISLGHMSRQNHTQGQAVGQHATQQPGPGPDPGPDPPRVPGGPPRSGPVQQCSGSVGQHVPSTSDPKVSAAGIVEHARDRDIRGLIMGSLLNVLRILLIVALTIARVLQ